MSTIVLKFPVQFGAQTITELVMRKGRLGDMKGIKIGESISMDSLILVASRLSGQPLKVIEDLDAEDAQKVMDLATSFFARCLVDGKTQ